MAQIKKTKKEIRKFWMILLLLDGKPRTQKDFKKELMYADPKDDFVMDISLRREISMGCFLTTKRLKKGEKNKQSLKKAVTDILEGVKDKGGVKRGGLKQEGIVQTYTKEVVKSGPNPQVYKLINDPETLFKIFNLINQTKLSEWEESRLRYEIFKSGFCQKLINKELVNKLNDFSRFPSDWLSDSDKFTDSELELISRIIKISPTALNLVLTLIYDAENYYYFFPPPIREYIKTQIISNLLIDLRREIPENYPIDYKIEIGLPDKPIKKGEKIKRVFKTKYLDGMITHKSESKIFEPSRDEFGRRIYKERTRD